ncbi:cTAGE family member 5 isoform X2 [Nerophis ophidion]|uniref:cTAGE family member 5 isoform X2 n=1 Tax=Nerophis ophidion TaxID=159077 RepID=UPI002ADFCD17|nr:cTAGE family member 5 isoform X2 [Nerophis ophidion]
MPTQLVKIIKRIFFSLDIPVGAPRMIFLADEFLLLSIVFAVLPHSNVGLLSDYKICGDKECESLMSRVRAVRDHHGKDCRFLNFRLGDSISVYHKLTGKWSDIWAGSIHKQFGYFSKEDVKEEQAFTKQEIRVETQESDFLCMDEFGYPIDSSHLDTNDEDSDLKSPPKEAGSQTIYSDETKSASPIPFKDVLTVLETTSGEVDEDNKEGGGTAKTLQASPEIPMALKEQGGSSASSWLSSSVTEWLALEKEEEPGNLATGEQTALQQMQAENSFPSSVTGWLGLKKEEKSESVKDDINSGQQETGTVDYFTSTMTGWLRFGSDKIEDSSTAKEYNDKKEMEGENFRSRKMYLDLDTPKLQEGDNKEMGTLEWLGNGLSSTLAFGLKSQDAGDKIQVNRGELEDEEKQPGSGSWFDLGIREILAFRKDNEDDITKSDTEFDDFVQGNVDVNMRETFTDSKTTALDGSLQDDQTYNPPQNRLQDISIVPIFTVVKPESAGRLVSEIKYSDEEQASSEVGGVKSGFESSLESEGDAKQGALCKEKGEDVEVDRDLEGTQDEKEVLAKKNQDDKQETQENLDLTSDNTAETETNCELMKKEGDSSPKFSSNYCKNTQIICDNPPEEEIWKTLTQNVKDAPVFASQVTDLFKESGFKSSPWSEVEESKEDEKSKEFNKDENQEMEEREDANGKQEKVQDLVERGALEEYSYKDKEMLDNLEGLHEKKQEEKEELEYVKEEEGGKRDRQEKVVLEEIKQEEVKMAEKFEAEEEADEYMEKFDELKDDKYQESEDMEKQSQVNIFQKKKNEEDGELVEDLKEADSFLRMELEQSKWTEIKEMAIPEDMVEIYDKSEEVKVSVQNKEEMFEEFKERDIREHKEKINNKKSEEVTELLQNKEEKLEKFKKIDIHEVVEEINGNKSEEVMELIQKKEEKLEELKEDGSKDILEDLEDDKRNEAEELFEEDLVNVKWEESKDRDGLEDVVELENNKLEEIKVFVKKTQEKDGPLVEKLEDNKELVEKSKLAELKDDKRNEAEELFEEELLNVKWEESIERDGQEDVVELENNKLEEIKTFVEKTQEKDGPLVEKFEDNKELVEKRKLAELKDKLEEGERLAEEKQEEVGEFMEEEFEHETQEDLNRSDEQDKNEQLQNNMEEEIREVQEKGSWPELMHIKDKGQQPWVEKSNMDLKTAENKQRVHDVVDRRNVKKEMESLRCVDELCTRSHQDVNKEEREKTHTEGGSGLLSDTQESMSLENIEHDKNWKLFEVLTVFNGKNDDGKGDTEHTENVMQDLDEKDDRGSQKIPDLQYSFEIIEKADMCNGMDAKCDSKTNTNGKLAEPLPSKVQFDENDQTTTESEGVFSLFKNVVLSFGQRPISKIKESTESFISGFDGKTIPQTPERDSTTNHQKDIQKELHPPTPMPTLCSHLTSPPVKPHQPDTLPKHNKNIQEHMSVREITILTDLLGKNKVHFLDYILDGEEFFSEHADSDDSILFDIETLLNYHKETLFPPSMRLSDAPEENKEKTRTITALQKLEILLEKVRHAFNSRKSVKKAQSSCVGETTEAESSQAMGLIVEEKKDDGYERRGETERVSPKEYRTQTGPPQSLEGIKEQILDSIHLVQPSSEVHAVNNFLKWFNVQVVSSLPDDIRPGPDLYGIPWEPVVISSFLGLMVLLLFSCRCYSSVKSRMYQRKEQWMAVQVAQQLEEKCKVLETLSKCEQEYEELENSLRDSGVLAQTQKTRDLEIKARQLNDAKTEQEEHLEQLKDQLCQKRDHRLEQEKKIAFLEESMKTMEEEIKELQSQDEQAHMTLKVYGMSSDRLQRNLESAGEENVLLLESNSQLRQQVEGWAERVSELEQEMRRCEMAHSGMQQDVANKDERIMSLTDRLLGMKAWDAELEGTPGRDEENGKTDSSQVHLQKVQKLIYAAKLNADLKSVDEDKDRVFAKLNDEVKAKEDLEVSIKELETEQLSMQADTKHYSDEVQRLQQKLQIMTEMYQENELKLHRLLTVEEKERLQKEEKLNKADKNIALAMEELNNYRLRAEEMEEELEKTKQSYQTQISAHEKKAHNNWLAARAADRELADFKRENALFRQKITDTQFKMEALDKDPFALDSLARPLPFRAERLPYGSSPLGRPASESRALLSPPTLIESSLARLSPRVPRSLGEPSGQGELERSGGPRSDSGSISPSWERDRRGPPPGPLPMPPGQLPPQGGPMYRRPGPPPGVMGPLPPPGPPFPHPRGLPASGPLGPFHPAVMTDGTYRENSVRPELDHREPFGSDRRTPPESDRRMEAAPPPGPPLGPIESSFPRRSPYGPPDFYPPRGPGGPPRMQMWAPPPGIMFPPRFPHGGLPPPPHLLSYGPPMRPPPPDGPFMGPSPLQQNLPAPPHSQLPDERTSSP